MLCNRFKIFLCSIALIALSVCVGNASAEMVAQHVGPTVFNGSSPVNLADGLSIGEEGTVEMDLTLPQAGPVAGAPQVWGINDGANEILIRMEDYYGGVTNVQIDYWKASGGKAFDQSTAHLAFPEDGLLHHVLWTWKSGESRLEIDDAVLNLLPGTLPTWTSTPGAHVLGNTFVGTLANVNVYDTFTPVPEPGTLALAACALMGLLCYAWRKRR